MTDPRGQHAASQQLLGAISNGQGISADNRVFAKDNSHEEVVEPLLGKGTSISARDDAYQRFLPGCCQQMEKLLLDTNTNFSTQAEPLTNCTEKTARPYSGSELSVCEDSLVSHESFCPGCISMIREWSKVLSQTKQAQYEFLTIPIGMKAIEQSASKGCNICRKFVISMAKQKAHIWGPLLSSGTADFSPSNLNTTYTLSDNNDRTHDLCLTYEWILHSLRLHPRLIFCQIDSMLYFLQSGAQLTNIEPLFTADSSLFTTSTGSTAALDLAKQWLKDCVCNHSLCSREGSFVPTRLIDTGPGDALAIRLWEPTDMAPMVRYLTLSHCWGQHTPLKLLQRNLASFKEHIDINQLSAVFQSSFQVAKHFGVRYIWIDSLCIIQDSKADWERESAKMSEIYAGSVCNLAATARSDGEESIFSNRTYSEISPLIIRMGSKYFDLQDPNLWQIEVDDSPLCTRGWVFQERLLAPRNLHFGAHQLFWECDCCLACEMYPISVPDIIRRESHVRLSSIIEDLPGVWQSMVRMYSATNLTYDSDRLVAFSGIAKRFLNQSQDEYLAGLWHSNLDAQLLWHVDPRYESSRTSSYVSPSWSWASVTGRLGGEMQDPGTNTHILINIIQASVDSSQHNPLGIVSGGVLQIQARLARAKIQFSESNPMTGLWKFYLEIGEELVEITFENRASISLFPDVVPTSVHSPNLICVPIRSGKLQNDQELIVQGLLLETCDWPLGQFQRFGCFELQGVKMLEFLSEACRTFDGKSGHDGFEYAKDDDATQRYNITIS